MTNYWVKNYEKKSNKRRLSKAMSLFFGLCQPGCWTASCFSIWLCLFDLSRFHPPVICFWLVQFFSKREDDGSALNSEIAMSRFESRLKWHGCIVPSRFSHSTLIIAVKYKFFPPILTVLKIISSVACEVCNIYARGVTDIKVFLKMYSLQL